MCLGVSFVQKSVEIYLDFEFREKKTGGLGALAQFMLFKVQEIIAVKAGLMTC